MAGKLKENFEKIQQSVRAKMEKNNLTHFPQILAVSKKQPAEKIRKLFELGLNDFGENYLQEALLKKEELKDLPIRWHYIGQIQTKKIKDIVGNFQLIQTVCRLEELQKMQEVASRKEITQDFLIQVNVAGEETKQGVSLVQLSDLIEATQQFKNLKLKGLMVFPPLEKDFEKTHHWFQLSYTLFEKKQNLLGDDFSVLSMGTSQDYLEAIKCGSTMVRLGESLMGPRP